MTKERIEELAALLAADALDGDDRRELDALLARQDPYTVAEVARFRDVTALMALTQVPDVPPPPRLRSRLLDQIRTLKASPTPTLIPPSKATPTPNPETTPPPATSPAPLTPGFRFHFATDTDGWVDLPVPGASVKLLSLDPQRGYAMVLGRLAAGASYPPHRHIHAEQVYVLSGDLSIGDQRLEAGDFHEAAAGTFHHINHSQHGCTILAVLSTEDLQAQMQAA